MGQSLPLGFSNHPLILSGVTDVIFIIADSEFPSTSKEQIVEGEGLLWDYRLDIVGQHIVIHVTLTDEDRTNDKREFKLVICPNLELADKDIKAVVEVMEYVGLNAPTNPDKTKQMRIMLMGTKIYDFSWEMEKLPDIKSREVAMVSKLKTDPESIRHMAEGRIDVASVTYRHLQNALIYRDMDPGFKLVKRFCPICNGGKVDNK